MCAPSFSTDSHNVLTPTYFMQILEDRGGLHANLFNMGYDNLIKERLAWVVSRLHIHFVRPLKWREDFIFSTWHRGQEGGLFYRREAKMSTPDGEDIIQATTGWLLLNVDTRSMVRHYEVAESEDTIFILSGQGGGRKRPSFANTGIRTDAIGLRTSRYEKRYR